MSGIYQKHVNSTTVTNPSSNSTFVGVDESGALFTKNESGVVSVVGGTSSGATPGGVTSSVQYNDGAGGLTGDSLFTRSDEGFFARTELGGPTGSVLINGSGNWSTISGGELPAVVSGNFYSSGDVLYGNFSGELGNLGLPFDGTVILSSDDLTGETGILTVRTDGAGITVDGLNSTSTVGLADQELAIFVEALDSSYVGSFHIDSTITEAAYENGVYKAEIALETTGATLQHSIDGNTFSSITANADGLSVVGVPSYDDDAAAATGGLPTGNLYQTTGSGPIPLNVAGILMVKQ